MEFDYFCSLNGFSTVICWKMVISRVQLWKFNRTTIANDGANLCCSWFNAIVMESYYEVPQTFYQLNLIGILIRKQRRLSARMPEQHRLILLERRLS